MTTRLEISATASPRELLPLFAQGLVALVMDGEQFLGLVTRMDLVNHLRRRLH